MPRAPKMSDKQLATVVYVDNVPYGPGPVPAKIADRIANPKVWADAEPEPAAPPAPPADECTPECAEVNHEGIDHDEYVEQVEAPDAEQS